MDKLNEKDFKELAPGENRCVQVGEKPVVVFNAEGNLYACEDFCPHLGGPLSEGSLTGKIIECPWHGAKFDLETGKNIAGPGRDLRIIPIEKKSV